MFINSTDKREMKYFIRKEEADAKFEWTKEKVQKFRELNDVLTKMQSQLIEQMMHIFETFSCFEKEGLSFLHGFKITGTYAFEKEILSKYDSIEDMTAEEKEEYELWDNIGYLASKELNLWQLIFDSGAGDFLPLSKVRIMQSFDSWHFSLPSEEEDFSVCSYLYHFLKYNGTISLEDFLKCTEKDFYPYVQVTLNCPVSEFRSYPFYHLRDDMIADILEKRALTINAFDWSQENIQKIMDVNSWVWKKTDELKSYLAFLSKALQKAARTDPFFENWDIDGHIEYQGSGATDIASFEMQRLMSERADFNHYTLRCSSDRPEIDDSMHDSEENLNWNFEVYKEHFTEEQQKVLFHYFMHVVFIDDWMYSLNDVIRMREEDFKVCLSIDF
ncbi:hypothetical protein MSI_14190 [Treponema sp. JC4]|uniref:hypothetical protein n=1 Tax=Treponema sp. JC4 TaxID=1124982 RepID=UPI00025AFD54|nr:hypothetical protein [Treponema sp. JC4]EID85036.1 hypothetical protein MSI_14190 [Treponema sp. JC4]